MLRAVKVVGPSQWRYRGPLLSLAGLCLGTASATGQVELESRSRNRQTL